MNMPAEAGRPTEYKFNEIKIGEHFDVLTMKSTGKRMKTKSGWRMRPGVLDSKNTRRVYNKVTQSRRYWEKETGKCFVVRAVRDEQFEVIAYRVTRVSKSEKKRTGVKKPLKKKTAQKRANEKKNRQ